MPIVNTGLGSTATDVIDEVSNSNFTAVPATVFEGLVNGDGWAYLITLGSVWLAYRLYEGVTSGARYAKAIPKRVTDNRVKSRNKKVREQIEKLEDSMSTRKPKGK